MTSIDEIKSRIDIVDLVSETVKLRRAGKSYTGFCPFHTNTRTPAFVVFPDSGTWRCFGQCNEGGDIFQFVMKKEGWDFAETLRYLADKAGVKLEPVTPQKQEQEDTNERLRVLLDEAVTFFRHHLTGTPAGEPARAYLRTRGLTDATIEAFGLGYAPAGWDAALHHFTAKGYTSTDLLAVGLVTERQEGEGVYDRFRNRIMIPIREAGGKMAGFGARILDPNDIPKFLNSPQTALFDKGRLLYGLDVARKPIRAADQVVIVEGYFDVIALHQAGFTNAVSPMGTALTEDQLRFLKKFTRRIVLALDADAAGEKATLRGLDVARHALDQSQELAFDAHGLLRSEARLQADLRVTTLPDGMDPDEVALRDPDEWRRIVENAQPVVIHVMETLVKGRDLEDGKVRAEIAAQVLPLIEDVPSLVERDTYRQRLARLLRVDERTLIGGSARASRARPVRVRIAQPDEAPPEGAQLATPEKRGHSLEAHILCLLLRRPENLYQLDRMLQQAQLTRLDQADFEKADHRALARILRDSLDQDALEPSEYVQVSTPEPVEPLLTSLLAPLPLGEPVGEKLLDELFRRMVDLRLMRITEGLKQLRLLQEDLPPDADPDQDPYAETVQQYLKIWQVLNKAQRSPLEID